MKIPWLELILGVGTAAIAAAAHGVPVNLFAESDAKLSRTFATVGSD